MFTKGSSMFCVSNDDLRNSLGELLWEPLWDALKLTLRGSLRGALPCSLWDALGVELQSAYKEVEYV